MQIWLVNQLLCAEECWAQVGMNFGRDQELQLIIQRQTKRGLWHQTECDGCCRHQVPKQRHQCDGEDQRGLIGWISAGSSLGLRTSTGRLGDGDGDSPVPVLHDGGSKGQNCWRNSLCGGRSMSRCCQGWALSLHGINPWHEGVHHDAARVELAWNQSLMPQKR